MTSITVSTHVSAPVERVFEVYTDIDKAAERIPDIVDLEVLSDGPFGWGSAGARPGSCSRRRRPRRCR